MQLPSPQLDDRGFADLMREAEQVIRDRCPSWTDFSAGDPGITLIEVFAYLTDILLYRLNRIPQKVHVALLNLLGVAPLPPAAAIATLKFTRSGDLDTELHIPAGTRVSDPGGAILFATIEDAIMATGCAIATARAIHADLIEGELIGVGTGEAGQSFRISRPPMLREFPLDEGIVVAVEATARELESQPPAREFDGRPFIIWTETDSFQHPTSADRFFVLDRLTGVITFAPARRIGPDRAQDPLPVPAKGREIRVWYRNGGGRRGNVAAGSLTQLVVQVPDVTVVNEARAAGGEDGESLEEAIRRSRETVTRVHTAVTARDFERICEEAGGVARARAYAQRDRWEFGEAGVVEVQIVPEIDASATVNGAVTPAVLAAHQVPDLKARVEAELAEHRPLGVRTAVRWTRCVPVSVSATVTVSSVESPDEVRTRLSARLNALLSPAGHWPFGRALRASDVYETILTEAGVRYCEQVSLAIAEGPEKDVGAIIRDPHRPQTFFAATDIGLFRSLDRARSWTLQDDGLPRGRIIRICASAELPGLVAAIAEDDDGRTWSVHVSRDGGERFELRDRIQGERVYDAAFILRGGRHALLLATRQTLRRLDALGDGVSSNIDRLVEDDTARQNGLFAVAAMRHPSGAPLAAVAARERGGVLLSLDGGQAGTFQLLPDSVGKDVRVLAFERDGERVFLWAGIAAEAGSDGDGIMRIEARSTGIDPAGWTSLSAGWKGGSCHSIDFTENLVVAGSNRAGVLVLDRRQPPGKQGWRQPAINCGLPINTERNTLFPVTGVAIGESAEAGTLVLAAGDNGIFLSSNTTSFVPVGRTTFTEQVPLPSNWLYCAGEHVLSVTREADDGGE